MASQRRLVDRNGGQVVANRQGSGAGDGTDLLQAENGQHRNASRYRDTRQRPQQTPALNAGCRQIINDRRLDADIPGYPVAQQAAGHPLRLAAQRPADTHVGFRQLSQFGILTHSSNQQFGLALR